MEYGEAVDELRLLLGRDVVQELLPASRFVAQKLANLLVEGREAWRIS